MSNRYAALRFLHLAIAASALAWAGGRCLLANEGFETAEPTWRLANADCSARLAVHQRTFSQAHTGHGSEYAAVQAAAGGSFVYLTHSIEPSRLIPELAASAWVMSDRTGVQLLARVVLPRTIDPRSRSALTTLVYGDALEEAGQWRRLTLVNLPELLESQSRVLRRQLPDVKIDVREAYIDLIVINAYGGSGLTQLWIDDLEISGGVTSPRFAADTAVGTSPIASVGHKSPHTGPLLRGTVLEVDGRAVALRMIEHQGEPFEWLKSLGFNAIQLSRPPTPEQCDTARRLELWLVAPPPHVVGASRITADHDRVLAWDLGSDLAGPELEATRSLAAEVRQSDTIERPLVCSPRAKFWHYSRVVDILIIETPPLFGGSELDDLGTWLRERQGLARPGTPIWVSAPSEPAPEVRSQLVAMEGDSSASLSIDPRQLRLLALTATAAGGRGICFQSSTRLSEGDARAKSLQLVNLDLTLIEPWAAAGEAADEIPASDPTARVAVMSTDRSQLLIITRTAHGQQHELAAPGKGEVSFVVSGGPRSSRAYLAAPVGLQPLKDARRVAGGIRIALADPGFMKLVVLSPDPLVYSHVIRRLAENSQVSATVLSQVALERLTAVEAVDRELTAQGRLFPAALESLTEARTSLRTCERLLDARDFAGSQDFAEQTLSSLAEIRRGRWEQAASAFPTPTASPCCTSFDALPLHWRLASRLKSMRWGDNVLPAGDLEVLNSLQQSGWRHYRGADTSLATTVELSSSAARAGASGLVLRAVPAKEGQSVGVVETPPLWITSAPVAVRAGQLIRVHGWIKLPAAIAGSRDGLLVFDSAGGLPLALRIEKPGEWQEFTLYRAAPSDGEFSITLALTGAGEAFIDDLAISLLADPGA